MRVIRKYPFGPPDDDHEVRLKMPAFSEVMTVKSIGSTAFLWALVDTDRPEQERVFEVHETGVEIPPHDYEKVTSLDYICTYIHGRALHVFERNILRDS